MTEVLGNLLPNVNRDALIADINTKISKYDLCPGLALQPIFSAPSPNHHNNINTTNTSNTSQLLESQQQQLIDQQQQLPYHQQQYHHHQHLQFQQQPNFTDSVSSTLFALQEQQLRKNQQQQQIQTAQTSLSSCKFVLNPPKLIPASTLIHND